MAAPKGNKFYLLAPYTGRPKVFSNPQEVWDKAVEYFEWCDANPWEEQDFVGKDATEVTRYKKVPYTIDGLCFYLQIGNSTWHDYGNKEGYKDFSDVYARVMQIIRSQKFTGAANGFFNANIIAKDLGLADKTELTSTQSVTVTVSKEEAKDISDSLDKDY